MKSRPPHDEVIAKCQEFLMMRNISSPDMSWSGCDKKLLNKALSYARKVMEWYPNYEFTEKDPWEIANRNLERKDAEKSSH
jgi:hypothetical protein